jgi:DNA adenine methylase
MRKERSYAEVYNEKDRGVVNVFRVLRDPLLNQRLRTALEFTPFARVEFKDCVAALTGDPVEDARRIIVRSFMGFSGLSGSGRATGFRANSNRSGTTPAHDWVNYKQALPWFLERLDGVVIEEKDALEVMRQHDSPDTLHYVDPPYCHETRTQTSAYAYEMTDAQHVELLDFLNNLRGKVVLSGYSTPLYELRLEGWARHVKTAHTNNKVKREETLWVKP